MHKVYELRLASYKNIDFLYATCLMLNAYWSSKAQLQRVMSDEIKYVENSVSRFNLSEYRATASIHKLYFQATVSAGYCAISPHRCSRSIPPI